LFLAALLLTCVGGASAQAPARRVTTIDALRQFPGYFHLQNVLLRGEFVENGRRVVLRAGDREIGVMLNEQRTISGPAEVRGTLIDVGRLEPDDARLARYEDREDPERWPRPGEELLLSLTGAVQAQPASSPSVRALALEPWRFGGQTVTIVGQFRGRNLFGDLPDAPGKSRYDFVLRSADAAIWVTGLQPRGKGFDLSVDARVDTGRWLQVSGLVSTDRGLVTVQGTAVIASSAPAPDPVEERLETAEPPQPAEVVFSTPVEGEIDVPSNASIRIQFSKGLDQPSLVGRLRISYADPETAGSGPAVPPEPRVTYDGSTQAMEIRFSSPFDPFRQVRVEILEGVKAFDGAPVIPWTLTFSTGD
jgi:hypothetical protein